MEFDVLLWWWNLLIYLLVWISWFLASLVVVVVYHWRGELVPPTNMADQQRRDSDIETEIQLLLLDIRSLREELIRAESIECPSLRNVITNLLTVLIRRANEKLQQLQERLGTNWSIPINKLINFTITEGHQIPYHLQNIFKNPMTES